MAIDWTKSMQQTYEYYEVDPGTWQNSRQLDFIISSSINWDADSDTLGSASFDTTESVGECYIRTYLIVKQGDEHEKIPLGTHLVQTPTDKYDGRIHKYSLDGYTPLIELKEKRPPLGYALLQNDKIMEKACDLTEEYLRAPIVKTSNTTPLQTNFVADPNNDTWLTFIADLMKNAKYKFSLDDMGRVLFAPDQETAAMTPIWTYTADNSSILYPEVTHTEDLYGLPNVVEVYYSKNKGYYYSRAVNEDPASPLSVPSRGREIVHRVTNPSLAGSPNQAYVDEYAKDVLREKSSIQYSITYSHGYCPARLGDCVLINYPEAGLNRVKAKIVSQKITCDTGCKVEETAVYSKQLWGE